MANESGKNERRSNLPHWEGVNAIVDKNLAKTSEFLHVENARSVILGTVEKREGQTVLGTAPDGTDFVATENYDLAYVGGGYPSAGLYRVSDSTVAPTPVVAALITSYSISVSDALTLTEEPIVWALGARRPAKSDSLTVTESVTMAMSTIFLTVSVNDSLTVSGSAAGGESIQVTINRAGVLSNVFFQVNDTLTVSMPTFHAISDTGARYLDNMDYTTANIYKLSVNKWLPCTDADAQGIRSGNFSHTIVDGQLHLVNGQDKNRYIDRDGSSVVTSADGMGSLYNSPRSHIINYYKDRLYLANYEWGGVHYGNTVLRSSLPVGILALINDDVTEPTTDIGTVRTRSFFSSTLDQDVAAYFHFNEDTGATTDTVNGLSLGAHSVGTAFSYTSGSPYVDVGNVSGLIPGMSGQFLSGYIAQITDGDTVGMSVNPSGSGGGNTTWTSDVPGRMTGISGNAAEFFGSNFTTQGQFFGTTSLTAPAAFTINFRWMLNTSSGSPAGGIFSYSNATTIYELYYTSTGNDITFTYAVGGAGGSVSESSITIPRNSDWHQITAYRSNGQFVGMVDGSSTSTWTNVTRTVRPYASFILGATLGTGQTATNSSSTSYGIDEVGIWNRALTGAEITLLGTKVPPIYGPSYVWKIPITDSTYMYSDTGANVYEVWRINTKIAEVTAYKIDDLYMYAQEADIDWFDSRTFQSQDQIYPKGTFSGHKIFRWPNNPTLTGDDVKQYGSFRLSGGDESDITMLDNVGNVMLIANRSNLASWNGATLNNFDLGIGCPSSRGHVKAFGALYFVHYTGVYTTSGTVPSIISSPIQTYIDGATKDGIEAAAAGVKGRSVFFCIGDVTLYNPDGSIRRQLSDVCLEYNLLQQTWYVHTNIKATAFESYLTTESAGELVLTDGSSKDVKLFLDGTTDDGEEVIFRVDTNPIPIAANIEDLSTPELVIVESERGSSMQCFISIDGDSFYQIEGRIEKGVSKLKVHDKQTDPDNAPLAHYVSLSFRDSSKQICKLGRVAVTYLPIGTSTSS